MNTTYSYIRYLLSDSKSLMKYFKDCYPVSLEDVRRELMLIERTHNEKTPDHYYRLGNEKSFEGIKHLSHLFTIGIRRLAENFLEYRRDRLYVRAEVQNEWQQTLPYMPPLLLIAAKIWHCHYSGKERAASYIKREITPNVLHTALLCPFIPELEDLKKEKGGMADLHLHFNGALETDYVWQDFLAHPINVLKEVTSETSQENVREQYSQLMEGLSNYDFRRLLLVANELRWELFDRVVQQKGTSGKSLASLLSAMKWTAHEDLSKRLHPVESMVSNAKRMMPLECYLYIRIFDYLARNEQDDTVAGLFHYYLLILGLANKMLVQQPTMFGFEEFQKYTSNGFRGYSEKQVSHRFLQLAGNRLDNYRFLEERFSPKDSAAQNLSYIHKINSEWAKFQSEKQKSTHGKLPEIALIAHFIKKAEKKVSPEISFLKLRKSLAHKTDALIDLMRHHPKSYPSVTGVDAAASEFDAPPEVFAVSYRRLRDAGMEHFTFHAGEDFFHLLSGLRAIYEAIEYLGLKRGDRIGHATAAGVDAKHWHTNVGETIFIRQGTYLDDLVFAYFLISKSDVGMLKSYIPSLLERIAELSWEVYKKNHPVSLLVKAWLMRSADPLILRDASHLDDVEQVYMSYHSKSVRERSASIIAVKTYEIFGENALQELQWLLLKEMQQREIVIETLPTSNVLIGHHRDFRTYHLYNWYQWSQEHEVPPIVVGTDDAGVFATNIYNEYCNIFCMLKEHGCNADDIMAFIRKLDENARLYAFTPLP